MIDLGHLLLQLVVILVTARVAGRVFRMFGQPQVIGEMAAGLALGPSLLGAVAPGALAWLFPADSLAPLSALSQLGVLLFMFAVGMRLDLTVLRNKARAAVFTSQASIALPFALGLLIAPGLHASLAPSGVPLLPFALFLGAAMSVTAFPVLARILTERGLLGTRVGSVAIASAAVDDVSAWCILAAVIAVARADATSSAGREFVVTILSSGAYVVLMATVGRRLLARLEREMARRGVGMSAQVVSAAIILALASAWITERLGIHALFGAFLAGTIMPRTPRGDQPGVATHIAERIEDVTGAVLLPVFFAFTGLRTSVGLLDGPGLWGACLLIFAVAVGGKLGGSAVAARIAGMSWRDALAIGTLMNTRGLMELVILNVGLEIGVISPTLFAMMVLMALATTIMTSPLLLAIMRREHAPATLQA
jgi:Kef-type K+ transport system membrane component KefB